MTRNFSNEPDPGILSVLQPIETLVLLITTAVAGLILTFWFAPSLAVFVPPYWMKMTANTAAGMLLSSLNLALTRPRSTLMARRCGLAAALIVLVLGVLTLTEYIGHFRFGIDTWLPSYSHARYPGRPSPQTAFAFVLLALCMMTSRQAKNRWSNPADILALLFTGFIFMMIGGHLYGAVDLISDNPTNLMASHTLFSFFCLNTAIILRRAEQGNLLAVLVNIGIGSRIVRLFLLPAIFAPFFFLAVDAYLIKSGVLSRPYANAAASAAASTLILCIVTWMGWRINDMERDLRDLSLTDELTEVYNRRGFYFLGQQAVLEAERADSRLALFYFDLDGLKHVNDMLGHEVGSDMIRAFAAILTTGFRKADIVGRIGGDEFAVITIRDHGARLDDILSRLEVLAAAFNGAEERSFQLSFSAGRAELNSAHSETLDDLIARADIIMYQNKAKKKLTV